MFTGLVETIGKIEDIAHHDGFKVLSVRLPEEAHGFAQLLGESIAVNGCCLTVTHFDQEYLRFDVSTETLSKTNLGALVPGSYVNLERAMRLGDRLGGHMVSGHVDGTAKIISIDKKAGGWDVLVLLPKEFARYIIAKGSITLDGTSLTVNELHDRPDACTIRLTLIPTTIEKTTFQFMDDHWRLNIEVDLLGKYLERLVAHSLQK